MSISHWCLHPLYRSLKKQQFICACWRKRTVHFGFCYIWRFLTKSSLTQLFSRHVSHNATCSLRYERQGQRRTTPGLAARQLNRSDWLCSRHMLFEVSHDGAKILSRDTVVDALQDIPALKDKYRTYKVNFNTNVNLIGDVGWNIPSWRLRQTQSAEYWTCLVVFWCRSFFLLLSWFLTREWLRRQHARGACLRCLQYRG